MDSAVSWTSNTRGGGRPGGDNLDIEQGPEAKGYRPDIIVLLTDGADTRGPRPIDAVQRTADRRPRVFMIGFGSSVPAPMVCTRQKLGGDVKGGGLDFGCGGGPNGACSGGFGGGGGDFRHFLLLDEPPLQSVADLTGGTYYWAERANQLLEVFLSLPSLITLQKQDVELTFAVLAAGAVSVLLAAGLSHRRNRLRLFSLVCGKSHK